MRIHIVVALLCCAGLAQAAEADKPAPARAPEANPVATGPAAASPAVPPAASRPMDRIELDTSVITGNRELPRVLYVVPWKRAELGEAGGKPANSLLDEVLSPVDRDVFRRQNRYYRALQPDGVASGNTVRAEGEK